MTEPFVSVAFVAFWGVSASVLRDHHAFVFLSGAFAGSELRRLVRWAIERYV